jgi:glycine/D-amino acid oxidase-like deaminating enzyme
MTELLDDLQSQPEAAVWSLVDMRWRGLQRLRELLGDEAFDFRMCGGYELFRPQDAANYEQSLVHLDRFNRELKAITGFSSTFQAADTKIEAFGLAGVEHIIANLAEGQIHTGKMMRALLQKVRDAGIEVIFGLPVEEIREDDRGVNLVTDGGWSVRAGQVLVATNGFAKRLFPELALRAVRNQVLITHPVPGLAIDGCFHYDRGYFYFRNVGNRLLLGGGRNLNFEGETTDRFGHTDQIQNALRELLRTVIFPRTEVTIDQWWSGILGVGDQKSPIIRRHSPRITLAVRMGGMGVAIGSLVGATAAEMLLEGDGEWKMEN